MSKSIDNDHDLVEMIKKRSVPKFGELLGVKHCNDRLSLDRFRIFYFANNKFVVYRKDPGNGCWYRFDSGSSKHHGKWNDPQEAKANGYVVK